MVSGSWPDAAGVPLDWAAVARHVRDLAGSVLRGQDAEDVAQQSMLEYWRKLRAGEEIRKPAGLLATIVRRRLRGFLMRRDRLVLLASDAFDLQASRWAPDPVAELDLSDALAAACATGIGRSEELVHEALTGSAAGSGGAIREWDEDLLARAQRAYQRKKKNCILKVP